jgi:hypothetical protein
LQSATDGDPFVHYISVNTTASGGTISVGLKKNVINTLVINKDESIVNGVTYPQSSKAKGTANNYNLMLFTQRADGTDCVTMQLYSFSITDGDTIVRDYIPCQTAEGEVGLWDKVDGIFYGNAGTGEFIPGNIIKPVVRRGNVIKPKHGSTPPQVEDLEEYELGYHGGALYVRENDEIVKISGGGGGSAGDIYIDQDELEEMLNGVFGQ